MRRLTTRIFFLSLTAAGALALAGTAGAVSTPIDSVSLTGGSSTTWDPTSWSDNEGCLGGAYSPVDNGSFGAQSDAFDGGLNLHVFSSAAKGFVGFADADGNGDLVGQALTVGPTRLVGVKITRTDEALSGPPTLRSLVKLVDPGRKSVTRVLSWCSGLGSDVDTGVRSSSSGDKAFTSHDRWVVTSDDPTTPSDPVDTHVLYGKGGHGPSSVLCNPGKKSDCVGVEFRVTIPAKSTRYLLFYTEMHDTNANATASANKYNNKHLNATLLSGLSSTVRHRILNWDLG